VTERSALALIRAIRRRDETTLRFGGHGDNWHMSWAADDTQLLALCDGSGLPGTKTLHYNSRLYRCIGIPPDVRFVDVSGYPQLLTDPSRRGGTGRYYGFGTLAVDGSIYQFLSTTNVRWDQPNPRFVGAKLIYSPDGGTTWCNQDGSTPVEWEPWESRSRANMVFFQEPGEAFQLLTVLQMGMDYQANRDGYVYVYSPNGNTEGSMNELVMFRVPKHKLLKRSSYEFFGGMRGGSGTWTSDIEERAVVHTFPRGWVNTKKSPYAWKPSVAFNSAVGVYMMTNWGTGCDPDGWWFGKPSYLGLWVAENPWGPWEQVHEETAWMPNGDLHARAYQPQIAPKWIAEDGRSFWLVWSDFQMCVAEDERVQRLERLRAAPQAPDAIESFFSQWRYYALNVQRVDIEVE
jgi:hypothetical protein